MKMRCILACSAGLALFCFQSTLRAASIMPPQYRGGINLITNGGTVARAITYSKGLIHAEFELNRREHI